MDKNYYYSRMSNNWQLTYNLISYYSGEYYEKDRRECFHKNGSTLLKKYIKEAYEKENLENFKAFLQIIKVSMIKKMSYRFKDTNDDFSFNVNLVDENSINNIIDEILADKTFADAIQEQEKPYNWLKEYFENKITSIGKDTSWSTAEEGECPF